MWGTLLFVVTRLFIFSGATLIIHLVTWLVLHGQLHDDDDATDDIVFDRADGRI